jgi:phosphoglycolate phosphatase-like HAD superfamily hydrolase
MPASHAIFVGDSPVDAQAAQACAMPFVLYEGGYGAHDCITETVHARFGDFGILPMIITDLVSQPNFVVAGVKLTG